MTRTEIERLAVVEEKMDSMKESVDNLRADLCKFIDAADGKYASKLTEFIVYGMAATMLLAVLYAFLHTIGL